MNRFSTKIRSKKGLFICIIAIMLVISAAIPKSAYATRGFNGYEGGISSGNAPNKNLLEYKEVVFLTGKPIVFTGTVLITKKAGKDNKVTTTYFYRLQNIEEKATLTRSVTMENTLEEKDNGQFVEKSVFTRTPTETIKIGSNTYTLQSYDFTRTCLIDTKPVINYYAGNLWGRKTYKDGTGLATSGNVGSITVDITGEFYGYDQSWGSTETETLKYKIQSEKPSDKEIIKWGGTADVKISTSTSQTMKYNQNEPQEISFDGGFTKTQSNLSLLEYESSMPEFDKNGVPIDSIVTTNKTLKIETFPEKERLVSHNLNNIRGHWAENAVKTLFALEIIVTDPKSFDPDEYMTRGEFAAAISKTSKSVAVEPALVATTKTTTASARAVGSRGAIAAPVSLFFDVTPDNRYFEGINDAAKRKLMSGVGDDRFAPDDTITVAQALSTFIRVVGLDNLAPADGAVTGFRDNNEIPAYARSSVYVAERIGLVQGDTRGYLRPNEPMTKARAAVFINRFIEYLQKGILKDYRNFY